MTTTLTTTPLGESTLLLTELFGANQERVTPVRIPTITYITESWGWLRGSYERYSIVHFVSGESIIVRETPEAIAAVLP